MREGKTPAAEKKPAAGRSKPAPPKPAAPNPLWNALALRVQPKLAVSAVDDPLEREADRMADRALAATSDSTVPIPASHFDGGPAAEAIPQGESGSPLDSAQRARFESGFHQDFSAVRIFTGPHADEAAGAIGARAYTAGPNIVFRRDEYAPGTSSGARLLAHELSHVIQQGQAGPMIQRQPQQGNTQQPAGVPALTGLQPRDMEANIWPEKGLMAFSLYGEPWVTVRWTPHGSITPTVHGNLDGFTSTVSVQVEASFDLRVTVNFETERHFAAGRIKTTKFKHSYRAAGSKVKINEHLASEKGTEEQLIGQDEHRLEEEYEGLDPEHMPPVDAWHAFKSPFWWETDSMEQLDLFAGAHPAYYWLAHRDDQGRIRARHFTEEGLQEAANAFREDPGLAAGVDRVYENGKPWPTVEALYELFYSSDYMAARGAPGDAPECLVFKHNRRSFGRKPLTHKQALDSWRELEKLDDTDGSSAIAEVVVDRGRFHALIAVGQSGNEWEIDLGYFKLRDVFFANVKQGGSWDETWEQHNTIYAAYLTPALDRTEGRDVLLSEAFDYSSGLLEKAGQAAYEKVERFAIATAASAVETSAKGVNVYTDPENLKQLILRFPFITVKERLDTLTFLGVSFYLQPVYAAVLGLPESAQLIAMGETSGGLSLATLTEAIKAHYEEMTNVVTSIRNHAVDPLTMPGDFGDSIREQTYKALGFDLDPKRFPHEEVWGSQMSWGGPLTGNAFVFAHESARRARVARHRKWLLIAAAVAAAVVIMIASAGVASPAAGAIVGLAFAAETTAYLVAFTVTEVVITAAITTLVTPAVNTFIMSGGSATWEDYKSSYSGLGWQFLKNLITFGVFKGLGVGIRALSVAGAGGKEAFEASAAWKSADFFMHLGTSAAGMFGASMLDYYLQHGSLPKGEAMHELLFETGLSIVLMEIGTRLASPWMKGIDAWSKRLKLDRITKGMEALRGKVTELNGKIAEYGARPGGAKSAGVQLLGEQRGLLTEKAKLIGEMKESVPKTETGLHQVLDAQLAEIRAQIDDIRQVELFASAEVEELSTSTEEVPQFSYKRGQEKALEDYYGRENVHRVGDHLVVKPVGGREMIFRPATHVEAGIMPDGTRNPDALQAWRNTSSARMRKVLERAVKTAAGDDVIHEVAKADPNSMSRDALADFESKLDRAEKRLDKLEKAGAGKKESLGRDGRSMTEWRQDLLAARERVMNRAELLGMMDHPAIKRLAALRMERTNTLENTVENHRMAVEEAEAVLDKALGERVKGMQAASPPPADVNALRTKLGARRMDVMRRARVLELSGRKYLDDVKNLRIGGSESMEALNRAEDVLETAEARMDDLSKKTLAKVTAARGADAIARIRTKGLEKLTDAQLGDALRSLGDEAFKLPEKALREMLLDSIEPDGSLRESGRRTAEWQPGDPANMPEAGEQPGYNEKVRERYWRNRAYYELEARKNGTAKWDPSSKDPIRVLSDEKLEQMRDKKPFVGVPNDPVSGRPMELEHSGAQQLVERRLRDAGFPRDEAILLSGTNDPRSLWEVTPLEHAFWDAWAHSFGRLRADPTGLMWEFTRLGDPRFERPLQPLTDAKIRAIVETVKARGYDLNANESARQLRGWLETENTIRNLGLKF